MYGVVCVLFVFVPVSGVAAAVAGQCTGSFDQRDQRIVKKCLSAHLLAGSPVFVTFVPSPNTAGRAAVRSHSHSLTNNCSDYSGSQLPPHSTLIIV